MTDFQLEWQRYRDARVIVNRRNQSIVFQALSEAAITRVTIEFDGEGDSGQINDVIAYAGENQVPIPAKVVELHSTRWGQAEVTTAEKTLAHAVEELCYGFLAQEHDGWENNDGAYGEFRFDVMERKIDLDFNARFTDCTTYSHTW
jgi:hypothetical protein